MLKAWHLPVAPFIKVQQDRLFITLWLSGESLPQRITLRAEEDNEELSLPMQRLRQAPQPGVVAWRGEISLASGYYRPYRLSSGHPHLAVRRYGVDCAVAARLGL